MELVGRRGAGNRVGRAEHHSSPSPTLTWPELSAKCRIARPLTPTMSPTPGDLVKLSAERRLASV